MRFEKGDSKEMVKEYRAACYSRLSLDHGGLPLKRPSAPVAVPATRDRSVSQEPAADNSHRRRFRVSQLRGIRNESGDLSEDDLPLTDFSIEPPQKKVLRGPS